MVETEGQRLMSLPGWCVQRGERRAPRHLNVQGQGCLGEGNKPGSRMAWEQLRTQNKAKQSRTRPWKARDSGLRNGEGQRVTESRGRLGEGKEPRAP